MSIRLRGTRSIDIDRSSANTSLLALRCCFQILDCLVRRFGSLRVLVVIHRLDDACDVRTGDERFIVTLARTSASIGALHPGDWTYSDLVKVDVLWLRGGNG